MTTETTEQKVFQIPSPNLAKFQEKWEKLIRRATKLSVTLPTYKIVKEEPRTRTVVRTRFNATLGYSERYDEDIVILYHHIIIDHPLVIVDGWQFIATLEHTNEGNITHNVSGKDLPAKYRECDAYCNQCNTNRYRKETFIVFNAETSEYKQIGRNCLALFLGVDGTMYANMAEIYYSASELAGASESEGGEGWGGSGPTYDYLDRYLSYVAEVIALNGWCSRKTAREFDKQSTSDVAMFHMYPPRGSRPEDFLFRIPSEASIEEAKNAIEWCSNLSDSEVDASEYLHNIRVICRRGIIGAKQYGFAASVVNAFHRSIMDQINKNNEAKVRAVSEYVGVIGKREIFTVMVEKVLALESDYGTSHMHIMKDLAGNRLTWFSSSKVFDTGVIMQIKATPKKQEEYKGVKQTILTRCTIVE